MKNAIAIIALSVLIVSTAASAAPTVSYQVATNIAQAVVKGPTNSLWSAVRERQERIDDLDEIRSGASAGATAVQPYAIADMETRTHASTTYQPTLVSGTNIKTVNGNSLLGSGNIVIQGGSGGSTDTNAVADIANAAIATNAIVADIATDVTNLTLDVSGKADKATTLDGYGITDAYTKNEADQKIADCIDAAISPSDSTFSNSVLSVGLNIDTNSVAVLNEIAATFGNFPITGTATTVGGLLAALAAAVALLRKRSAHLDNSGFGDEQFAHDIFGKQAAKTALMIPLEAKTDSFTAEDGHAYAVTMTGTVTITMPTTTAGKAAIFQARFSAAAQQSVEFSTTTLVKFDGADCGIVKAGKDALLSAMWNGSAWDLVWKNEA